MNIPTGGDRAPLDAETVVALGDVLNGLVETLLSRPEGPGDVDVAVAQQLVDISSMLAILGAEQSRMEVWLKVLAIFAKEAGLSATRNADVAAFDEKLSDDLLATCKAIIEWVGEADYWKMRQA